MQNVEAIKLGPTPRKLTPFVQALSGCTLWQMLNGGSHARERLESARCTILPSLRKAVVIPGYSDIAIFGGEAFRHIMLDVLH